MSRAQKESEVVLADLRRQRDACPPNTSAHKHYVELIEAELRNNEVIWDELSEEEKNCRAKLALMGAAKPPRKATQAKLEDRAKATVDAWVEKHSGDDPIRLLNQWQDDLFKRLDRAETPCEEWWPKALIDAISAKVASYYLALDPEDLEKVKALKDSQAPKSSEPSPLDTQVGGEHYKKFGEYQPWQVLGKWLNEDELKGFMKGTVIAYLAREKNGREDIRKALHTIQLYLEISEAEKKDFRDFGGLSDSERAAWDKGVNS